MKQKRNHSEKNFYKVTPHLLLALMIAVSILGIHVFRIQYDKNNLQEETQEFRKYGKYYAMITSDDRAGFWQAVCDGAKAEGDLSDAYVELFAGDIGTGYSMEQRMEIAIASGVDGIILEGEENVVLKRTMKKAIEREIPVVTMTQDMADSNRISFVGISQYDLGQTYGKETVKLAKQMLSEHEDVYQATSPLKIVLLMGQESDTSGKNLLLSGIKEEIAKDSFLSDRVNIDIDAADDVVSVTQEGSLSDRVVIDTYMVDDSGAFTAEESIRDIFIGQESVPDILICLSEIHTNCAYQAVIDYNRVGKTNIIGYYDSESILNAIQKEIIFSTISMDTAQMGRYCVNALNDYLDEGYVSDYYAVDTYVVDQNNVKEYLKGEE